MKKPKFKVGDRVRLKIRPTAIILSKMSDGRIEIHQMLQGSWFWREEELERVK